MKNNNVKHFWKKVQIKKELYLEINKLNNNDDFEKNVNEVDENSKKYLNWLNK